MGVTKARDCVAVAVWERVAGEEREALAAREAAGEPEALGEALGER